MHISTSVLIKVKLFVETLVAYFRCVKELAKNFIAQCEHCDFTARMMVKYLNL